VIAPGTLVAGRYEIVRLIGEGGMGEVYEATHALIGKRVALKLLNAEYARNQEAVERFHQEAKVEPAPKPPKPAKPAHDWTYPGD